jgi:hypothetical protein
MEPTMTELQIKQTNLSPDLEALIDRAAAKGAAKALADIGLSDDKVKVDIHDLRSLLHAIQVAKRTAWQTFIRLLTTGMLLAMLAGIAIKLKVFGEHPGC